MKLEEEDQREIISDLEQQLDVAEERLRDVSDPSLPMRAASRISGGGLVGGAIGIGIDVTSAILNAREADRLKQRIAQLQDGLTRARRRLEAAVHGQAQKRRAIEDSQADFVQNDCFSLGYSHEVLNF